MENSQDMINTHSNMLLSQEAKKGPFQGQQGEGWRPPPFGDFKAPSPPLKSLKISVVKRPKHQSLETHSK